MHSPLQPQDLPARHPQIAKHKQHLQARCVLGQPPVSHLGMTEPLLDHPKRMFYLRPYARLGLLHLVHDLAHGCAHVQCLPVSRAHVHMQVRLNALRVLTLGHALV